MKKILALGLLSSLTLTACGSVPSLSHSDVNEMTDKFFMTYQNSAEDAFAMTSELFQSVASVQTLQDLLDNSSIVVGMTSVELDDFAVVQVQDGEEGGPYSLVGATGMAYYDEAYIEDLTVLERILEVEWQYDFEQERWALNFFDLSAGDLIPDPVIEDTETEGEVLFDGETSEEAQETVENTEEVTE